MSHSSLKNRIVIVTEGTKKLRGFVDRTSAAEGAKMVVHYHSPSAQEDVDSTIVAIGNNRGDEFEL
ncbi:hypothetical protein K7432_010503 [Basidiobolus ranarum]|uniref:Uncharacterized protein n=1 Tax=Basidiobolus ranarum TaxID=34480 RepID=A0ABR2VWA1_9FUNG